VSFITFVILNILFLNLFSYISFLSIYTVFYVYIGNYASCGRLFYLFRRSLILQFNSNGLLKLSINILFVTIEFLKNFKWHFDGCLTYTSATLRVAVKHPSNNSLNSDKKFNFKAERNGAFAAKPLGESPRNFSYLHFLQVANLKMHRI